MKCLSQPLIPGLRQRGDRGAAAVPVASPGHRGARRGHQVESPSGHIEYMPLLAGANDLFVLTLEGSEK